MKNLIFAFVVIVGACISARAANNCTGATYYDSDTDTCIACPNGYDYNQDAGKTDVTQCQIHCDAGTWIEGYTQLEYIESTGTQYIDTGQNFMYGDEFFFDYMPIESYSTEDKGYGNGGGSASEISGGGRRVNGNVVMYIVGSNISYSPTLSYDNALLHRYTEHWTIEDGVFSSTLTDVSSGAVYNLSKSGISNSYNPSTMVYLFRANAGSTGTPSHLRIYGTWLKRANGSYAFNLIPARRNSDGVVGMYDAVTGTFFTNAGSGTFIAGSDVGAIGGECVNVGAGYYAPASTVNYGSVGTRTACPAGTYSNVTNASSCTPCAGATYNDETGMAACKSCPAGYDYNTDAGKDDITDCQIHCDAGTWVEEYTQLEYIESTGTQYIDTGQNFMYGDEFFFDYMPIENYSKENKGYGAGTNTSGNNITCGGRRRSTTGVVSLWIWSHNDYSPRLAYVDTLGRRYTEHWTLNNGTLTSTLTDKVSNDIYTVSKSRISSSYNSGNSVYLWRDHSSENAYPSKSRIYGTWLKRSNGDYAFNMIPARRNSDGVLGMYDTVTQTFFTNAGTGTFIAGQGISNACVNVGAGYYAAASTVNYGSVGTRTACPIGTYSDIPNGTSVAACTPCAGATYNDETGMAACKSCPAGYDYNTTAGKTDITQCQIHCDAGTWIGEYTRLEYIESTGTQYIDTGIVPQNYNYSAEFTMSASGWGKLFFGMSTSMSDSWGGNGYQFGIANSNGNSSWGGASALTTASGLGVSINVFYTYKITKNGFYVNDVLKSAISSPADFAATGSLYIGRTNNPNGGSYNGGRSKWSMVKIYDDNGVLVFDGIPVRRNSDGVVGMYDTVTETFFTNAGTGTFITGSDIDGGLGCTDVGAGYYSGASTVNFGSLGTRTACPAGTYSDIPNGTSVAACTPCAGATYNDETGMTSCKSCPAGYDYNTDAGKTDITQCQIHCDAGTYMTGEYTQLEYIESTGTQWIDTGVGFNSNIGYEFEYQPITTNNFVTQAGTTGQVIAQSGNVWEFRFNGSTNRRPNPATIDLTKFVNIKYNIDNKCSVDDKIVDISNLTLNNAGSIRLFGPNYTSSGRMKFFKVYDNGILVNNLVPMRRNSDGVVGMYDAVTGTFFTNAGSGTFIADSDGGAIGVQCTNVGAGYYAPASTVNFGSVGTRTQCPAGLYTVGYGHGADNANDCGRILHIGDNVIHMRRNKETTPSVNIKMDNGDMFYISLSPINHNVSRLHFQYNGNEYTAYDDSLFYGERDFDTGTQIVQ